MTIRCFQEAESWTEGTPYRLQVRGKFDLRYGMQVEILAIRPATDDDAGDGFDFFDLVESSQIPPDELLKKLRRPDRALHRPSRAQGAGREHPRRASSRCSRRCRPRRTSTIAYTSGLLEHVWSMTRIASFLADHYAKYYDQLIPRSTGVVIVAPTILHDIGKLRELEYHPVEAKYTKEGCLIGHVLMGRDMVREAARTDRGFPDETCSCLEHAILAHHGKREFGSPVLPQTLEALLVSYIDDLDAKMNIVARERMDSQTDDGFTDRIFALDNRRFYKGVPEGVPADPACPPSS